MKAFIRICNLNNEEDVRCIREVISNYEGVIACEINFKKQEIQLVYDARSLSIDNLINSIEMLGYIVL